eukprot:TRINITY_DN21444_c0_g1_i1.p2 TRINITY_DN21444_c0_g1~~TRINITY_DN21444_c0_g1_i1.p2  ORF type:complete len:115 (-),score=27.90 TRINITY_DN21444_c0_g1_i1:29-373(-)
MLHTVPTAHKMRKHPPMHLMQRNRDRLTHRCIAEKKKSKRTASHTVEGMLHTTTHPDPGSRFGDDIVKQHPSSSAQQTPANDTMVHSRRHHIASGQIPMYAQLSRMGRITANTG